ncbi:hypothetical protein [Micromonospora sp. LOL_024]|uniref:hypothetical protein n=1 Tax=Micromonospora sp. LOL_024 TaxID=3345412 RepID=UPI003A89B4E9
MVARLRAGGAAPTAFELAEERRLRLGALEHKRREITRMRDRREIDDTVLRELQASRDAEEIRLLGPTATE